MAISTEELQDIHLTEKIIWRLLGRGTVDAKHPYRLCSIATVNDEGNPDTRMVVLRACNIENKLLSFHTHIRSGKVAHFKNQPEVCMLFWDQRQSLQLRIYGTVTIHHQDETALKNLAELPAQQLQHYAQPCPPGSQLDTSLPEVFQEELIPQNFAWINVKIHTIDALHLGRTGIHTRLQYRYSGNELISATYVKA